MNFTEIQQLERIVLYDGDCGFCSHSVQFILAHKNRSIYFLPLQSPVAEKMLSKHHIPLDMSTLYYYENGELYSQSSAIIRILKSLKGLYPILSYLLYLIPAFIRNKGYSWIAKRRHKLTNNNCILPTSEERQFFL